MRTIASRGGKTSGKRRMITVSPAKRHLAAVAGANARWGKPALTEDEKKAHLQSWEAGVAHGAGWTEQKSKRCPGAGNAGSPRRTPNRAVPDPVEAVAQIPELAEVLKVSDDPRVRRFLAALATPRYRNYKPATLARKFGLTPDEFANIWRDHALRMATFRALSAIPRVVEDLIREAKTTMISCPRCGGSGDIAKTGVVCLDCEGTGKARQPGNPHAIDLLFQLVGNPPKQSATSKV
jgi:hypothetical protein